MVAAYDSYLNRLDVPAGGVVFPVSLRLAAKSCEPLMRLLEQVPNSQLLFWTGRGAPPVPSWMVSKLQTEFDAAGKSERIGFDCSVARSLLEACQAEVLVRLQGAANCMGWM